METTLSFLNKYRKMIGSEPLLFFVLAILTLQYGQYQTSELKDIFKPVSGVLFTFGLLIALLRVVGTFFKQRPARGMIDGLLAGLFAGILGGSFGYGYHDYSEPALLRIILCILFAVPSGGALGVVIDLLHPDRSIPWRKYFGSLMLAISLLFIVVGMGFTLFLPKMHYGNGINVFDLQLICEFYLFFMVTIVVISFEWPIKKLVRRFLLLIIAIVPARALTFFVQLNDSNPLINGRLGERQFLVDSSKEGAERVFAIGSGYYVMAIAVIVFMIWTLSAYAFYYKDHPLSLWLDGKVKA